MDNLSKSDIKKIIKDELDDFARNQLDKEMAAILKNSNSSTRKETIELTKMALAAFAKYMWIRKSVWQADIK